MDYIKNIAIILTSLTAVYGIIFGLIQYRRSVKLQQAELRSKMRLRLLEDENLRKVFAALEDDEEVLRTLPHIDLLMAATFIEDVEFLIRSKLLAEREARLAFGYIATLMVNSEIFRMQINWGHDGWEDLRNFAQRFAQKQFK